MNKRSLSGRLLLLLLCRCAFLSLLGVEVNRASQLRLQANNLVFEDSKILIDFIQVVNLNFEVLIRNEPISDFLTIQDFISTQVSAQELQVLTVNRALRSPSHPMMLT